MLDREAPGIAEAIRADSLAKTPHALLSRGGRGSWAPSSSTCPDPPAVAATATPSSAGARTRTRPAGRDRVDAHQSDSADDRRLAPRRFASLVKLEHTVFALPFAYVGMLLALDEGARGAGLALGDGRHGGARTLAMGLNRLIDAELDARNPRTAVRELPAGSLSRAQVGVLCALAFAVFLVAVFQLDPLVRWLWPVPVAFFVVYPYLKRLTWLCHVWLGVSLGLAPVGAWAAVTGELPWPAWALGGAVALWVAGFDLFYSLFDLEHDRAEGLPSGRRPLRRARVFAGAAPSRTAALALSPSPVSGSTSGSGTGSASAPSRRCSREHLLVRPGDLRRLDAAFFTVNGV